MIIETILLPAFLAGLMGSTHCIGMCGGIVGVLTMSLSQKVRHSHLYLWPYLLSYNLGRIGSYTVAGLLMGLLGTQLVNRLPMENPRLVAMWMSGLFMIALGLYLGAWWQTLAVLEKTGGYLWRRIEPFGRRFLPVKTPGQAFGLGLVWGWLPCGLVYSMLTFSLASGNVWYGGLLMFAFGVGTLPMLLAMGATAQWLTRFAQHIWVRRIAGAVVISFGLLILFSSLHHASY